MIKDKIEKIGITDEQAAKIWEVWAGEWHHHDGEFDQVWLGYYELTYKTEVEISKLKKFIKIFRDSGMAYHSPTVNCEGEPNGSGTFLHERYQDLSWGQIKELLNNAEIKNDKTR